MHDPSRHVSRFGSLDVLFVMATAQEYGPRLREMIDPLICGVGPVEAAMTTSAVLSLLGHRGRLPHLVFTLGSAGSRRLNQTDVYQVSSVAYRDMDASALGFEKGVTPFLDQPAIIPVPSRLDGVPEASLATGASVVSGRDYDDIAADMVDMESYAIVRSAQTFVVPFVGLRGISDGRSDVRRLADWTEYLTLIDFKLASILKRFEAQARLGSFQPRLPAAVSAEKYDAPRNILQ